MGMTYEDACDAGYDGPSPSQERQHRNRVSKNSMLDPRDPDYDEELAECECEICGATDDTVRSDTDDLCSGCYEENKCEEEE